MRRAANNQLQSPSAEDDVLSSAGRDQIAADENEREKHQHEMERVHRQRPLAKQPNNCQYLALTLFPTAVNKIEQEPMIRRENRKQK